MLHFPAGGTGPAAFRRPGTGLNAAEGFIKAVHRSNGTMLRATVVGRQAAEALQGWSIAAAGGLKMGQVAQVMQAYPFPAVGNQQIARDAYLGA